MTCSALIHSYIERLTSSRPYDQAAAFASNARCRPLGLSRNLLLDQSIAGFDSNIETVTMERTVEISQISRLAPVLGLFGKEIVEASGRAPQA